MNGRNYSCLHRGGSGVKRSKGIAFGLVAMSALLAGCGVQAAQASQYIHVKPGSDVVNLKVDAGYNNGLNMPTIDGVQANGHLTISVPKGAIVRMTVTNKGPFPEAYGIYKPGSWNLAFAHAGDPWYGNLGAELNPVAGLLYGQSKTYTFTASQVGTYTLADLMNNPGTPNTTDYTPGSTAPVSNIWATFKVTSSGSPTMTTNE